MDKKNYYDNDYEIDLLYVLKKVLYRWRLIFMVGVVMAVVVFAGKYVLDMKAYQQELAQTEQTVPEVEVLEYTEEEIEEMKANLTEEERLNLRAAEMAKEQLAILQEYMENSIWFSTDAYNRPVVRLHYYIDTTDNVYSDMEERAFHTASLMNAYVNYVSNADLSKRVAEESGLNTEPQYIVELIWVSGNTLEQAELVVSVSGKTIQQAQQIADCVTAAMAEYSAVLDTEVGQHELVLVDSFQNVIMDSTMASSQYKLQDQEISLSRELLNLKKEFSTIQSQLFALSAGETESVEGDSAGNSAVKPSVNILYLVLGFMVGAILTAGCVAVPVLFGGKLDTTDTLEQTYGLHLFGDLAEGKEHRFIVDKLLDRMFSKMQGTVEERLAYTTANIKLACQKAEVKKLLIISTVDMSAQAQAKLQAMSEDLKDAGIDAVMMADIHHNADALAKMSDVECVVLAEKPEETTRKALEKELALCHTQKVQVLGVVAF